MKNELTIAIVTRQRPDKLKRCLESVANQSVKASRIIVIDNDQLKQAKPVCDNFSGFLPIKYISLPKPNVPATRNQALKICSTSYLGFVDDDCVLDKNWIFQAQKATRSNPKSVFIVGKSLLLNPHSLIARVQFYRQIFWFNYKLLNNIVAGPFNLDSKNVILNVDFIKKNKIFFDKSLYLNRVGDHADVDLGLQLYKAGGSGIFYPKIVVRHEETGSFWSFINKAYQRGRVGFLLYDKWQLKNELAFLPDLRTTKWIRRIKYWPTEFKHWVGGLDEKLPVKFLLFLLMKLHDRAYLQGFYDQAKKSGRLSGIMDEILRDDQ